MATKRPDQWGRISSSLVTAVSVAAIVLAVAFFVVDRPGDGADSAVDAAHPPASSGSDTQPAGQQAGDPSDRSAATGDRAKAQKTAQQGAEQKDQQQDRKQPRQKQPSDRPTSDAVPDVYVEVFNNSSISGLAASRSAQLRDAGWQVVGVDNWRGVIPASTVYYPSGMAEQADRLAKELGISRTHTAVAPMKFDRLTVILTADAG